MITTLSINNYRSVLNLTMLLGPLTVVTGPNGSGKSNLYRALRLLAETAQGGVINSLASEGGLESTIWAGPEKISKRMRDGVVPIEGGTRQEVVRLRMGVVTDTLGYSISLGLPEPSRSAFCFDPEIKRETIWAGPFYRPASVLVDRKGPMVKVRDGRSWKVVEQHLSSFQSMFDQLSDPIAAPEVFQVREMIRGWRFYDYFRTDKDAPARQAQLGTRTPVLNHDGRDLAAALQTIREIGNHEALDNAISDAFPGARIDVVHHNDGRFSVEFYQEGLLRPLTSAELSDGTLRYLLLVAALLTPRPPLLMVLNEPETSLHPDLLPALARLIIKASDNTQVWIVSHASRLIAALSDHYECHGIQLEKVLGQTEIQGQGILDTPPWHYRE
ncbi:AAA family ATPase [Spartinivicinus poritis]|uniref:AAA family ATPase n=1 Tax=Spartinivicinus poritis TaxID=2994640 RepID=A0ABT5UDQ2_9GAMM|nr:AAA family ATPase [Spartinivicinus sp. A2-2]MDE1463647.1 AAA family ATPase [Spartinivicinus sp. A2-2]